MNNRKAFLLGCSHVAGSELEGFGIGYRTPFNISNSFAAQFAKLIHYEPINLAKPGASNDYIFRNFYDLIERKQITQEDIVIVFWTGEERIEIQDPITKDWMQFSIGMSMDIPGYNDIHKEFYNLYQRLMCIDPMRGTLNKIKNIHALNTLADQHNITVLNGDSFREIDFRGKSKYKWLYPHSSFCTWAEENKYAKSDQWYHYVLKAHTDFAILCAEEYNHKIIGSVATNYWHYFLRQNYNKMSDSIKQIADAFKNRHVQKNQYEYNWCLDGSSSDSHFKIFHYMSSNNKYSPVSIVNKDAKVRFFNDCEGYCTDYIFDTIHWLINIHNFDPQNCIYENLALNIKSRYDEYCIKKNIKDKIKVQGICAYNDCTKPQYIILPNEVEELSPHDKKLFLSLNWNGWDHRLLFIALLEFYHLIDQGHISVPCADKFKYDKVKDWIAFFYSVKTQLDSGIYEDGIDILVKLYGLKSKYPLILDDRSEFNKPDDCWLPNVKKGLEKYRKNSILEVVSETYADGTIMFTEKTFYPIQYGIPFLQINSQGSLHTLRILGYKTYSPYINESYDEESNMAMRVRKVVEELERLNKLRNENPVVFYENYEKMLEIAAYNKQHFYTQTSPQIFYE